MLLSVGLERRVGAVDLDAGHLQLVDEMDRLVRSCAVERDQDRRRIALAAVLDRDAIDLVDLPQQRPAIRGVSSSAIVTISS